jgi:S-adenosylmethionine:tRNA ribosyltransferase-isomerase
MQVPDYLLPETSIAQVPLERRDSARLLDALDPDGVLVDRQVWDLPSLLGDGDVVVVNNSRVLPARLRLRKAGGAHAEVLLLAPEPGDARCWSALVRPGRKLPPGCLMGIPLGKADFDGPPPCGQADPGEGIEEMIEVGERLAGGQRRVRLLEDPVTIFERCGEMALPPYIKARLADPERYQTVYAASPGSVAAPTAGLHLTRPVLDAVVARGASLHTVDLAVGLATFRPVRTQRAEDHEMHSERYSVPEATWRACLDARRSGGRVVAVGTTTVRALESAAASGVLDGDSTLFIRPGFDWSVTDVLLTNFHQPRSTLLVLLEAFMGTRWRGVYEEALRRGYRFLSFGDAMIAARR